MIITRKENFLLIENEADSITEFATQLTKDHEELGEHNIIIDLSKYKDLDPKSLMVFLELSKLYREKNKSFVLVNNALGIDELPEELIVVPTINEGEDLIQMEEIQRDLGF
ncbi:ribonuclease Z [Christiangramia salexigens]|uniref:Ribonuclease Z n=1 Tax=Christiangramia salexigens TaxID=1913577 RepID=A0A1L3J2Q9_9FLAO|nr:ribonuclease Z [Christiangramia salexigens]APG59403.1 ribonuclease Z [Christiangramia salexigens]